MSVGRSSIKRVAAGAPAAQAKTEEVKAPAKKPAARKTTPKATPKTTVKKTAEVKKAPVAKSENKVPEAKIAIGTALPYYLL